MSQNFSWGLSGNYSGRLLCVCQKSSVRKLFLLFFLSLFTMTGYAQLALQNFESGIPATWAQANNAVGTTAWTTSTGCSGTTAAFIDPTAENIGNGNTAQYYLITPQITVPVNGQLRFFTKQSSTTDFGNIYQIRISTASQTDINSFTTLIASWTENELNTVTPLGCEEKVVNLPANIAPGLSIYVAFVLVNNQNAATPNADTWFIDDVSLQTGQICDDVLAENFTATGITPTTANLSWTHPSATQFQIQVLPTGVLPGSTGIVTGNSYSATLLDPSTGYDVYIKSICSLSTSGWAGPFPFTTPAVGSSCASAITIPNTGAPFIYSGNLDNFQNPDVTYTTQGANCLPASVTANYLNGGKAFFSYTPTQDGLITITQIAEPTGWNYITGVFVYEGCTNVGVECLGGLRTTDAGVAKKIPNLYVEAGHTYIIVVSTEYFGESNVDFTLKVETAPCAPPAVFSYTDLMQDSIKLSWNNVGNFATAWQYVVLPAGSPAPTGAGTPTSTNVDNLINTGLAAGTAYDFYVRSVCSSVPGPWSDPYTFTTQCAVFNTPYTESFDGAFGTNPTPCWTPLDINGDDTTWKFGWENISLSNQEMASHNDMMVMPMVNLGTTPKRLRFKYQTTNGVRRYSIVLSTTGIGPNNFTSTILTTQNVDTNYELFEKIVNIPTTITGNVNIAFYVDPGVETDYNNLIIDDVVVEDKPACPDPVALNAEGITTSTAQLSWEAGDIETQWQIVVQPKNSGEPTVAGELISSNIYTADELTHATQYEYYVRAYCSSSQQSNWVGPYYFTTLCSVFDTPFYENFNDDDASTHKSCWSFVDVNGDGAQWNMNATEPSIQGNPFFGTSEYDDRMISPAININGAKALKFDYRAAFSFFFPNPRFGVEVLMSTTDTNPSSFSVVMPLMEFTNTEYLQKTVYVNANGPVYFAFRVPPTFSTAGGTSILQIDNVIIEDAPACPAPEALKAAGITQTSAVLSWTKGFMETQWNVAVQPAGSGIPTGSGVLTSNNTAFPSGTLLPNTQYEYYVRAYCNGTDQSTWVGPYTFTTLCTAFTTPFIETFENNSVSEGCWRVTNGNSDSFAWNLNVTLNPYEGIQSAGVFTGSNGNNNDWLISPTVTITAGQRLRYYYRVYSSDFWEDLDVKLSTNGIELDQFTTTLYTVDYFDEPPLNNPEWKEKVINFPAGITGNVNVAWHIPQKDPNPWNYRGQMLIIDKVVIEDIPLCPAPVNLGVENITDVEAQISWEATGTETSWNVYVQPAGLPAPVGNGDGQYLHTASANPYTVTGLTPAIAYDYYVRAVCDGSNSEWIGPLQFITRCSFENLCEYTITLSGGSSSGVGGGIDLIQNGVKLQTMEFATSAWNEVPPPADYLVLLCTGVEFSLFWDAVGTAPGQYPGAMVEVKDGEGNVVWTGDLGVLAPRSTIYTGLSLCGPITCPQPTNLAVSGTSVFSWTAGGTETQWEVAVQPVANGTLPQAGTIVTTNSYTPQDSDFVNLQAGTYEFFVRAICGAGDSSFWSGPYEFVRNDDSSKAIQVPVNSGEACEQSVSAISFAGATPSAETMTCTGTNYGDVWVEFVAASKVHRIELGNFSAKNIYQGGTGQEPQVGLTLYKVVGTTLQEVACSNNNVITAAYTSELEIGATYKVRLTLNNDMPYSTLDVCVTTPLDICKLNIPNGGFEQPEANLGLGNFFSQNVVPGWRNNLLESDTSLYETIFLQEAFGLSGFTPYEGGQAIQLMVPDDTIAPPVDPNDMVNIRGMYQDIDSSEITKFDYSFAHLSGGHTVQFYAGPPTGPFVLLEEHTGLLTWNFYEGTYNVPAGQSVTRFIFRSKDMAIGNMLDAVSIVANTGIITQSHTLDCATNSTTLEAEGKGTWVADEANPSAVVIAEPNSTTTAVNNFASPGEYKFYWRTRYCEYTIVITKQGIDVTPEVTTPVNYCQDAVAVPLTASDLEGYSHVWYTEVTGGTALDTAPTPETATAGTTSYYVAYVSNDGCEGARVEIEVVVNEKTISVTDFTYDAESYCEGAQNPLITLDPEFTSNGEFTASPEGLSLDAATGAINLSDSQAGTYEVTYTVQPDASVCNEGGSHTVTIIVSGNLDSIISQECRDNNVWLVAASADGAFDENVHYTWKNESGETVGDDRPDFNVTEYVTLEGDLEVPLNFTVTVTLGACAADSGYTVTSMMCEVQRGISPNGDGINENLDLSGLGVRSISIFNRYGKKIYVHGSGYTNQWHGQDTNGNELPDGTYFYSIEKADGGNITGWIYINRQY